MCLALGKNKICSLLSYCMEARGTMVTGQESDVIGLRNMGTMGSFKEMLLGQELRCKE